MESFYDGKQRTLVRENKKIDQINLQIKALTIKFQTLFENQLARREINANLKGILATLGTRRM